MESFLHPADIPRVVVEFTRAEWMRTISNFRQWAVAQREAAGFEDAFVEEAIARQGDAITAGIVAWGDRHIPKYKEIPGPSTQAFQVTQEPNPYGFYGQQMVSLDPHTFVHFPRAQFQDQWHNEMTLTYLGLLLLVSYSTYPQSGHLPFSRWELAVKFCQCFAAYPDPEKMGIVNRLLHMFFARLTFDETFPQGNLA
jgi:hypothetical protein